MNSRYSRDSDLHDLQDDLNDPVSNDREISLGTSTIVGIFFALALVCALFFGFGYSMGRHSAQPSATTVEPVAATSSTVPKPTPGSLAPASEKEGDDAATPGTSPASPTAADVTATVSARDPQPDSQRAQAEPPSKPAPLVRVALPATQSPAAAAPGTASSVVQVAAVSHQQDADVLLTELKKRGYTVAIRQEPQDKLLHVQLGPFPTRKDAEAMRQRLLADGYNAIVK